MNYSFNRLRVTCLWIDKKRTVFDMAFLVFDNIEMDFLFSDSGRQSAKRRRVLGCVCIAERSTADVTRRGTRCSIMEKILSTACALTVKTWQYSGECNPECF